MRIAETANSIDHGCAKEGIFKHIFLKKPSNIPVNVTLSLESKRRKKQSHSKLYCDIFPTSKNAQAICPSDINISRLPVLIVFKVKLLYCIVLMHQKTITGVTRRLNICMLMEEGVMIKIKPSPY